VSESTKPRGVVDLGKVQDVRDGRASTGKANSIQLKTASGGSVCYVCDTETEQVEWMSGLEGAMQKILKRVAGAVRAGGWMGTGLAAADWVAGVPTGATAHSSKAAS
jgi:hypothetical protein